MKVIVLMENTALEGCGLTPEHGLSLYIEYRGRKLLLDAGSSGKFADNAQALGVEPGHIAKTISLYDGESAMVILAAGDAKIDNRKFKERFGFKAKMLSPEDALRFTGHEVGGICPFGLASPLRVYLDVSLRRFDTVYPACGTANSAVRLTCDELEKASEALGWVDLCKLPE